MKLKRKNIKDLRTYVKVERKYFHDVVKHWKQYWYGWISCNIEDDMLNDEYFKRYSMKHVNLPQIRQECIDNYGLSFVAKKDNKTYKFVGVQIAVDDFYWIFRNDEGDRIFSSCVGKFSDVVHYYGK